MTKTPDPPLPFRREKTLALGALAFLAPIPLGFTNALEMTTLVIYLVLLGVFLWSASRGRILSLSNTALNVVGCAYAGLLWVDLRFGSRTLLKTALHLLLFTTLVKLASIKKDRDFSVGLALTGFLFLASVATSFHYSVGIFLVVYLAVAWPILVRWALWRDLAAAPDEWKRDAEVRKLPGWAPTATSLLFAVLVAAPLFFMLPRLRAPYIRGVEQGRDISTGFSETVDPELYGTLKRSERVYLRITSTEPISPGRAEDLRIRALAFTKYEGKTWVKPERAGAFLPGAPGSFQPLVKARLDPARRQMMTIDLSPLQSRYVPYPVHALAVRFGESSFRLLHHIFYAETDEVRNLRLPFEPEKTLEYEALYGGEPAPDIVPPGRDSSDKPLGSERIAAFTRSLLLGVDPKTTPERAARRIENALETRFAYTLEVPPSGPNPVEDFLFVRRAGHCESFATAMALMLREIGIPSRFVTGFAGGEIGVFGRYVIVRGHSAHAWVEAWCGPQLGWVTFDPTPAAGRPVFERVPLARRFRQLADGVEFFYDRYVLSFGQSDQVELIRRVREAVGESLDRVHDIAAWARTIVAGATRARKQAVVLGLLVLAAFVLFVLVRRFTKRTNPRWRTRGLPPASYAYRRLQKALRRNGAPLGESSAPSETLAAAAQLGDRVERIAQEIVRCYLAESFGGREFDEADARRLIDLARRAREAVADSRSRLAA